MGNNIFKNEIKTNQFTTKINLDRVIKNQWEKLHPLAKFPKDGVHRDLFLSQMSKRDIYAFGLAMQYYAEIKSGKQFYKDIKKLVKEKSK